MPKTSGVHEQASTSGRLGRQHDILPWVGYGLVVLVVVGATALAAGEPTSWATDIYDRMPDPLVGLVAAAIAVVAADWLVPRSPRLGGTLSLIALVTSTWAAAVHTRRSVRHTLADLTGSETTVQSVCAWAAAAAVLGTGIYLAVLLAAFASDKVRQLRMDEPPPTVPLESQGEFADAVVARCRTPEPTGFKLIPITGRWGDGKSYLLSLIEHRLHENGMSVVRVNVWQSEADEHFYQSIVRDVYGTDTFTRRLGWLRRPFGLAIDRALRWRPTSFKLGVLNTKAEVTIRHLPPALPYAKALSCDLRSRHTPDKASVVIIVDELDRATPVAAQTALTILRRAFDEAGVVVLLSYVEEHVHFNTFNPERGMLDDLRSALMSIVDQERRLEARGEGVLMPADLSDRVRKFVGLGEQTRHAPSSDGSPEAGASAAARLRVADYVQDWVAIENDLSLLEHYIQWSDHKQRSVQRRAAEKYIHGGSMKVPPLGPRDVADVFVASDGYREAREQVVGPRDEAATRAFDETVRQAVTASMEALVGGLAIARDDDEPPPLRHLKTSIDEFLPRLARRAATRSGSSADVRWDVIASALYRTAQLKAGA